MPLPAPSVSVCIPVNRGEPYLAESIRSVLDQTYRDFELVVLDNASPDRADIIARRVGDVRIRVERTPSPVPQSEHWNRAVQLSRAQLVKLVRPTDLLHPRCLDMQVSPMEADPGLAVVAARRHLVDDQSRVVIPRRGLSGLTGVRTGVEVARRVVRSRSNPIGEPAGVLFRREDFFAAGGWRGDRAFTMDLDLWMRLLQFGEFLGLPEPLAASRMLRTAPDERRAVLEEQQLLLEEIAETDTFSVRGIDLTLGRLFSPTGRFKRRAVAAVAG
ncbi:glycosyltransferase family 2 protein [Pseudonocardia lacus]|uniref:glycosyltransferase family 2 protein n=1 Tax=Pseudonocardia lacus TaxID=2835865 RepID=UPI001BDCFF7B|nr:glycosyltransferase [Pseudonocardia lacus]